MKTRLIIWLLRFRPVWLLFSDVTVSTGPKTKVAQSGIQGQTGHMYTNLSSISTTGFVWIPLIYIRYTVQSRTLLFIKYLGGCAGMNYFWLCWQVVIQRSSGIFPAVFVIHSCQVPRPREQILHWASRDIAGCTDRLKKMISDGILQWTTMMSESFLCYLTAYNSTTSKEPLKVEYSLFPSILDQQSHGYTVTRQPPPKTPVSSEKCIIVLGSV